jgi:hypothetical protein
MAIEDGFKFWRHAMKRVALLLVMELVLGIPVFASIIHVPAESPTIQSGIDAAIDGDTVLVSPGIYCEHINFSGKNIVVKSEQGPNVTKIHRRNHNSREPLVKFISGESSLATFEGFLAESTLAAPAIFINNSSATLRGNIFISNYSINGGAIEASGGEVYAFDNTFWENEALEAGAIWCSQARLLASGNRFLCNLGRYHASAIYINVSTNSLIHHNNFFQHSLGCATPATVSLYLCESGQIYNNDFIANYDGAAIKCNGSDNLRIYNNIITWNAGVGIHADSSLACIVKYNDVWHNGLDYDGLNPGPGSISADPLLVDIESARLHSNSPCINTGDPASPRDPDGSIADMGARYYLPDSGYLAGTVLDETASPIAGVCISVRGKAIFDSTDINGYYCLGNLSCDLDYDLFFSHYSYNETTLTEIVPVANDTTFLSMVLTVAPPRGAIEGIVTDSLEQPLENVIVEIESAGVSDTTDIFGQFILSDLRPISYDIVFRHRDYADTIVSGFSVPSGDTAILNLSGLPVGCMYIPGDINGSGLTNGLDIVYGVSFFKGGLQPVISCSMCPQAAPFYAAGDVNGSCSFNGIDITYLVIYFKGGPGLLHCPSCPSIGR